MPKLTFQPGVVSERTPLDVGLGFIDANLMRWRMQRAQPIGGWKRVATSDSTLPGITRAIHEWSDLSGTKIFAFAGQGTVYVLVGDNLYNITPAGVLVGPVDASYATGFGIGTFSTGLYSGDQTQSTDLIAPIVLEPGTWSLDNFGEDLVFCPRGGQLYIWSPEGGFEGPSSLISASPLSDGYVPVSANGLFVNPQTEILVAYGTPPIGSTVPDPMQIRWSDLANPYVWNPTQANSAGGYRLPTGSQIITAIPTFYQVIFFTDKGPYVMSYLGNSLVFGFQPLATSASIISPNAGVNRGSTVYWMDSGNFYLYNGNVSVLECPLKQEIFAEINVLQSWKTFSGLNGNFNEIGWFYPVGNEVDTYVTYNHAENTWNKGKLPRTCYSWTSDSPNPVMVSPDGKIYLHEYGLDADGLPMPFSLTSGDIEIEDGEYFALLQRLIPDFLFAQNSPNGLNQRILIDVRVRNSSTDPYEVVKTLAVTAADVNRGYYDLKVRGRRISFRIYNDTSLTGNSFIMGKTAVFYKKNGRK